MKKYVKEYKGHKVPDGATHWLVNGFAKWVDNKSISVIGCFQGATWKKCSHGMLQNAIELPEVEQEWSGEGLPPVGAECEISCDGSSWFKRLINYSSESIVVFTNELGIELAYSTKGTIRFRPVKTHEQKDREAFIDAARSIVKLGMRRAVIDEVAGIMFDAGFTAPKAAENDQK